MPKIIHVDEMLEILMQKAPKRGEVFQVALEVVAQVMADELCAVLDVAQKGEAAFAGVDCAGTCAAFAPAFPDQPCPEEFDMYDPGGDW